MATALLFGFIMPYTPEKCYKNLVKAPKFFLIGRLRGTKRQVELGFTCFFVPVFV